jgi:hypothetical protein
MKRNAVAAVVATVGIFGLASSVAQATPGNGAAALTHSFLCDGQALTFVIEGGNGFWSTAYVVETGETFVPTSFTFDGTLLGAKQGPLPQEQVTCTEPFQGGTLTLTGYFVPPTG